MKQTGILLHYNAIAKFNELFYKDVLLHSDIVEAEKNFSKLTEPQGGIIENFWGYIYQKDGVRYLLKSTDFEAVKDAVAIKPKSTQKVSYKSDVYHLITRVASINFRKENKITFKECVDRFNGFSKTEPRQGLLLTLLVISSYFGRVNARVSTPAGNGKDSSIEILNGLFGKASSIVNPTIAKLESLANTNKLIALNEVNDLAPADFRVVEQFLLESGAFKNEITKRSRAFEGVGEVINIENLSLLLFYNDVDCYPLDREYFDVVSKSAVKDRFPAFRFYGVIDEDFSKINTVNVHEFVKANMDWYKDILYSLEYHVLNVDDAWRVKGFNIKPNKTYSSPRWVANLTALNKFVALYADTKEEFNELKKAFEDAISEYNAMLVYMRMSVEADKWLERKGKTFKESLPPINNEKDEDGQRKLL